jgi:hypothetical protein
LQNIYATAVFADGHHLRTGGVTLHTLRWVTTTFKLIQGQHFKRDFHGFQRRHDRPQNWFDPAGFLLL